MKKRFLSILLALLMVVLTACGTANAPAADADNSDRTLVVGISFGLDSFDPQYSWNMFCTRQVYDTLLSLDENGELAPNIAKSWDVSDDGRVYTFNLRDDVKFTNGEAVTAETCVFTFERAMASSYVDSLFTPASIASVEAVDTYTFQVTLHNPNPAFLGALTNVSSAAPYGALVCPSVVEAAGDQFGLNAESVIGCGPYKLTEWVADEYCIFEANEEYFGGAPDIKKVKFVLMSESSTAVIALETGDMDIYFSDIATSAIPTVEANDSLGLYVGAAPRYYYFVLNTAEGPCADVRVRQAIQLAVDREKQSLLVTDGYGELIDQLGGWNFTANPGNKVWPERDVEKAKALIEEAGMVGATVTLKASNSTAYSDMMTALQQDLEEIGLVCDVQMQERATWVEDVCTNGAFDISVVQFASNPDMDCMYTNLHSSCFHASGNYGCYSNPEVDALLDEARLSSDPAARAEVYAKVIDLTTADVPVIPLMSAVAARAYTKDLGYEANYIAYDCLCYYHWN